MQLSPFRISNKIGEAYLEKLEDRRRLQSFYRLVTLSICAEHVRGLHNKPKAEVHPGH
jgi:hypothetical protein